MDLPEVNIAGNNDAMNFLLGFADCMFAFGVGLADRGYIDREELAEIFDGLVKQQAAREEAQHPARQYAAKMFAQLYQMPVIDKPS